MLTVTSSLGLLFFPWLRVDTDRHQGPISYPSELHIRKTGNKNKKEKNKQTQEIKKAGNREAGGGQSEVRCGREPGRNIEDGEKKTFVGYIPPFVMY